MLNINEMMPASPQKGVSKNVMDLTINTENGNDEQCKSKENKGDAIENSTLAQESSKTQNDSLIQTAPGFISDTNGNTLGVFKVPKKKATTEGKQPGNPKESSSNSLRLQSSDNKNGSSSAKLNNNIISNLNKSLKAKQKIINSKEPHPKNPTIISEILNNNTPQSGSFPNNTLSSNDNEGGNSNTNITQNNVTSSSNNASNSNISEISAKPATSKDKGKKISKQNSTRTDFFAAKLACAVDDVDTSDSDETFVYENNPNSYDKGSVSHSTNNRAASQSDNVSNNGSVLNLGGAGPALNSPAILEESSDGGNAPTSASIHSVHSSKMPTIRSTNSILPQDASYNNPPSTLESANNKARPLHYRAGSSYSIPHLPPVLQSNEEKLQSDSAHGRHNLSYGHYPSIPYNLPKATSHQTLGNVNKAVSHQNNSSQKSNAASINDIYNEDRYSYDEVDDTDIIDDEDSTEEDYYPTNRIGESSQAVTPGYTNDIPMPESTNTSDAKIESNTKPINNTPGASRNTSKKNYKSSNSSSKLRSTTSKLFDKKGSQPRRYSIIPDDIDIEDFDDELIYYDNNIRFPYNSNSVNFNDTNSLLNQNQRIPHYRSLNLNFHGSKRNPNIKNKRYLSTGQAFLPNDNGHDTPPHSSNNKFPKSDIFPFPYPEPHQKYYGDSDDYEEGDPLNNIQDEEQRFYSPNSRNVSGHYNHPHLSPGRGRFVLPRKKSNNFKNNRVDYIKRIVYILISISFILAIGFIMGFVLATTKDLSDASIQSFENPIVSQDELLFNIIVEAVNPGWFTIDVNEVELDIFAKSGYLPEVNAKSDSLTKTSEKGNVETVLLGTIKNLESTMSFTGGVFSRTPVQQSGAIRLLRPGRNLTTFENYNPNNNTDPDNSDKWEIISKNPFDLIVRGILKYDLPMSKNSKSVVVNKVGYIDPNQDSF